MSTDDVDLLAINCGTVTAPAGCGKTHLIAAALTRHASRKRILVLTHTNAGCVALRGRLDRFGVPSRAYRLSTIDGWAMRLIGTFPMRSGHAPAILALTRPAADYPNIREAAATLLSSGHINDILDASYSHLIVDEYQDCSERQHAIVTWAAQTLQTSVLGDPMQAIFNFGSDGLVSWTGLCIPAGNTVVASPRARVTLPEISPGQIHIKEACEMKNRSFETGRNETRVLEACLTEHCVFEVRAHERRPIETSADSVCTVETGKVELCSVETRVGEDSIFEMRVGEVSTFEICRT